MKEARVLIAGGGIGGLVAALALNQRGFEVSLYEQAPELHELGAGVTISPNPIGPQFESGVGDAAPQLKTLRAVGVPPEAFRSIPWKVLQDAQAPSLE